MKDQRIRLNKDEMKIIYEALGFYNDRKSSQRDTEYLTSKLEGRFKTMIDGYYQRNRKK